MQLYLLRHADADTPAERDVDRTLSKKGISQAKSVAQFLANHEIRPGLILSSPVRRAHETACIVSAEVCVAPWLACGLEPAVALEKISALRQHASVLLVGHEPDFSRFAAYLLGLPTPTAFHVRKASLTLIEIELFKPRAGRLEFSIPCKLM
jgi:phosphohistidine phosphatase